MVQILDDLGYKVYSKVLDAKIGLPQTRRRVFMVCILKPIFKIIIIMYFHHLLN